MSWKLVHACDFLALPASTSGIICQLQAQKYYAIVNTFVLEACCATAHTCAQAVRAIGRCAVSLERAAERCINVLLELIQTKVTYVVQEAVVVIKDIFRRYPNRCAPRARRQAGALGVQTRESDAPVLRFAHLIGGPRQKARALLAFACWQPAAVNAMRIAAWASAVVCCTPTLARVRRAEAAGKREGAVHALAGRRPRRSSPQHRAGVFIWEAVMSCT